MVAPRLPASIVELTLESLEGAFAKPGEYDRWELPNLSGLTRLTSLTMRCRDDCGALSWDQHSPGNDYGVPSGLQVPLLCRAHTLPPPALATPHCRVTFAAGLSRVVQSCFQAVAVSGAQLLAAVSSMSRAIILLAKQRARTCLLLRRCSAWSLRMCSCRTSSTCVGAQRAAGKCRCWSCPGTVCASRSVTRLPEGCRGPHNAESTWPCLQL